MLLLLFAGAKSGAPPPAPPNPLQTVLTQWDYERYRKRRPLFNTLLEEAEYDLKLAADKLQSVAFNKKPAARARYEELKKIVEELRSEELLNQYDKQIRRQEILDKLRTIENLRKLHEKYGPGLLNVEFLGPRIFKK